MEKITNAPDLEADWLQSPVKEQSDRLHPLRDITLDPYYGQVRKVRLLRTRYVVGSGEGCDIRIRDPFVSPRHCELVVPREGAGYQVVDLDSRNGIFLNGVRVRSAPLPPQGSLRVGRSTLAWRAEAAPQESGGAWVVADPAMVEIVASLRRVARTGLSVLLLGDTGTGKEILARLIHDASERARGAYVTVNGSLTGGDLAESELFGHKRGAFTGAETSRAGALRSAHGGSLFLDEVADIPAAAQVKLLRAVETGEIKSLGSDTVDRADFRLISATSQNIHARIDENRFRLDLYYRLAGYVVHVPPLRERPLDILAIARKFLDEIGMSLDRECEGRLLSYPWPGNVRELKSQLSRALLLARDEGLARVLPRHFAMERGLVSVVKKGKVLTLSELEREYIQASLERNGWNRIIAARELGIARSTLFHKMRRFRISDGA